MHRTSGEDDIQNPSRATGNTFLASQSYGATNNLPPNQNLPTQRPEWHPKITPYRFLTFASTVGLATAKALAAQSGSSGLAITLEWVGGTFLSILLFTVSNYDSGERTDVPDFLVGLFRIDCMDFKNDPRFISTPPIRSPQLLHIVYFYRNLSTAVAWIDWTMAVPVFTLLYCLGLYEYNSVNFWGPFFISDYSDLLLSLGAGVTNSLALVACTALIAATYYILGLITYQPSLIQETKTNDFVFYKLLGQEILAAGMLTGVVTLLFLVRSVSISVTARGSPVRRIVGAVRQPILRCLRRTISLSPATPTTVQHGRRVSTSHEVYFTPSIDMVLYIFIHIAAHAFGFIACCTIGIAAQWPSNPYSLPGPPQSSSTGWFWDNILMHVVPGCSYALGVLGYLLFVGGIMALAGAFLMFMVAPFYQSRGNMELLQGRLIGPNPFRHLW